MAKRIALRHSCVHGGAFQTFPGHLIAPGAQKSLVFTGGV